MTSFRNLQTRIYYMLAPHRIAVRYYAPMTMAIMGDDSAG